MHQVKYVNSKTQKHCTLYCSPRILSRSHHLVSYTYKVCASHNSKWNMCIHWCVNFCHRVIINWKLIDVHTIVGKFRINFWLKQIINDIAIFTKMVHINIIIIRQTNLLGRLKIVCILYHKHWLHQRSGTTYWLQTTFLLSCVSHIFSDI